MNKDKLRKTICAALIVKNEEKNLAACLDTVKDWADEIVILDSGSTDKTKDIALEYTQKFYCNDTWPGFGPQRRLAQKYVESDYVFWIDPDERVTEELRNSIINVVEASESGKVYQVDRLSYAFYKCIKHSGWSPDWVTRFYPTQLTIYDEALVHEKVIVPNGVEVVKLKGHLLHYTYDDLHHYLAKTTRYLKIWADEREGKKKSGVFTAVGHALASFIKMYIFKLGFLDGRHGFILAWVTMNSSFIKYTDLWLRSQENKK